MSRLDSFIRRMSAQRDILNGLAGKLDGLSGAIFEFGYGSGRTYDHLREVFPQRRIVVFESVPSVVRIPFRPEDLVLGDIRDTAPQFGDGTAALVHADIETAEPDLDAAITAWLPAVVTRLLEPGGYAMSSCDLGDRRLRPEPLPPGIDAGRYHLFRRIEP